MAIQTVGTQKAQVSPAEMSSRWERIRDLFSNVTDLFDLYFVSPKRISCLGRDYRANLSVKEQAELDFNFSSIPKQ